METYLGVDVGTTATKAALFDETGHTVGVVERPTQLLHPGPERVEQDAEEVLHSVGAVSRDVLAAVDGPPPSILAITGQGDGCWLVDDNGHPVRSAVSWMDGRATGILTEWERDGTADALFRTTGNALFPGAQACILRWLDEHEPASLDRASTAAYCKDVIFQRLTGVRATDPSDASLPFGDPDEARYSDDALKLCGLEHRADLLAPVTSPVPIAPLDAAGAALTGLPAGTPVTDGPFDLAACARGAGLTKPGGGLLIIGTTLGCEVLTDHFDVDTHPAGMHLSSNPPGMWLRTLPAMVGSASLDWTLRVLGLEHAELDAAIAASPPGAHGVEMLPYLSPSGERAPFIEPNAHGQLTGLHLATTPADMVRATCEGIAFAARDCFDATPLDGSLVVCGGGTRSRPWLQIFADALQRPLAVAPVPNVGTLGAVLSALEATGRTVDPTTWMPVSDIVEPDRDLAAQYDDGFSRYRQHRAGAQQLWRSR